MYYVYEYDMHMHIQMYMYIYLFIFYIFTCTCIHVYMHMCVNMCIHASHVPCPEGGGLEEERGINSPARVQSFVEVSFQNATLRTRCVCVCVCVCVCETVLCWFHVCCICGM